MVRTYKVNEKKGKEPITKTTFLSSLQQFYKDGIDVRVNSVSRVFNNQYNDEKPSIFVNLDIIGNMPRCLAYEVDDDGNYVKELDKLGKQTNKLIEIDGTGKSVSLSYNLKYSDEYDDEIDDLEFDVSSWSSFYPLLNYGLKENGMVDRNNSDSVYVTHEDIKEALEDLEFKATSRYVDNGKFSYYSLIPKKPMKPMKITDDDELFGY